MLDIGSYNVLTIKRFEMGGAVLDGGDKEIYLPKKELPKNLAAGDPIKVFIYNDAKESLKATTQIPKAVVGDFAVLTVKEVTDFGAFLDWGIGKDLFVPKKYQQVPLAVGDTPVVRLTLDYEKKGVLGTCKLSTYFEYDVSRLEENQKVTLIVFDTTPLGYNVVIDNTYQGVLYSNEIFEDLFIGDVRTGYIKKIRDDGRIDVSLQPQGFLNALNEASVVILSALKDNGGFLPLHDKSSPEEIKEHLKLSKKIFKKTIGVLYKRGIIVIEDAGVRLGK